MWLVTALGDSLSGHIEAMRAYRSGIAPVEGLLSSGTMLAGRIDPAWEASLDAPVGCTRLERLLLHTIRSICPEGLPSDTVIVLSTTKGNIDCLASSLESLDERTLLPKLAQRLADALPTSAPITVVSNACISGVSALIYAKRLLEHGRYRHALVLGGDLLTPFVATGFEAFHSMSTSLCRPYDVARDGLNLGEGVGAILLGMRAPRADDLVLSGGAISNDANHISGPSRTGDGLYLAIRGALGEAGLVPDQIDMVNLHGTATIYNDEMESKALALASLSQTPAQSLKPYIGHTLGASGVVETILAALQMPRGLCLATLGYADAGTPMPLAISGTHSTLEMRHVLKTASGFGGCNAALVLSRGEEASTALCPEIHVPRPVSSVEIGEGRIDWGAGKSFEASSRSFATFSREAYKALCVPNMKFYKMDDLCKLGYLATEVLLAERSYAPEEVGIILACRAASLDTDLKHQARIASPEGASPAIFVYTLPNVVLGEIAIRHRIQGENTCFVLPQHDQALLLDYARIAMAHGALRYCIVGWCDLLGDHYSAQMTLLAY